MIKLIAVGNRFMKDDGIAIIIAEMLKEELTDNHLEIIIGETDCQTSFYSLLDDDYIIILDALCIGAEPGSIHLFNLENVMLQSFGYFMPHDTGIIDLMRLYNKNFKGLFIGIEIAEIAIGNNLSPVLQEKLPVICSKIEDIISTILLKHYSGVL